MIKRYLQDLINQDLAKGKIIIIYGPRRVGKTTLAQQFITENSVYYNCDQEETKKLLETTNLSVLISLVKQYSRIIIDEAQRVENIGLTLKILIDNFPDKQFIVTGSSSFDIANRVSEPLTGRFFAYNMYPVSLSEMSNFLNPVQILEQLNELIIFGSYPEILTLSDKQDRSRILKNIIENYLLKDVLSIESIKQPKVIIEILQAVALQIGGEVSYEEIGKLVGLNKLTVKKYLDLCEQIFVLFSLSPFYSNKRKSIRKKKKYYFYDLGLRNALINNFNSLPLRQDKGALWENFVILERMKKNAEAKHYPNYYFWRSYTNQEIDLLEEENGVLNGFEAKYDKSKISVDVLNSFKEIGGNDLLVINRENFISELLK